MAQGDVEYSPLLVNATIYETRGEVSLVQDESNESVKSTCPRCASEVEVPKDHHYKMIECPQCNEPFEALGKGTMISAQNFLEQIRRLQSFDSEDD